MSNSLFNTFYRLALAPFRAIATGIRRGTAEATHEYTTFTRLQLWHDQQIRQSFALSFFLLCATSLLLFLVFHLLPPQVPLFYTKIGSQQLAAKTILSVFPIGSAVVWLLNFFLARIFFLKETLLSQIAALTTLLFSILSISALLNIILLVIP